MQRPETATTVRVAGRQDADDRRPVRRDQGGHRRLLLLRGRRPRRRDRAGRADPGRAHGRRRSRCARWWSGSDPRPGLPRRVGTRPRCADRLPRRLRPRRGSHAGGVRHRRRAVAARRRPRQPRRLARRRPPATGPSTASAATARWPRRRGCSRCPRRRRTTDGRDDVSRRAARADLHLLPSGARDRGAGGAHAADARRPHHRRDRPRLPRARADDGPAARAGQAQDQGRRDPVPGAARPPAARPARRGARGRLPDLQRGLRRPRRPGRRGDPARAGARRADARRARGARPAGADAAARRAPRGAVPRRRAGAARRPGPLALGRRRRSPTGARRSTGRSRCAGAGRTSCRRRSPRCTPTSRATGRRSPRSTASSRASPARRSSS